MGICESADSNPGYYEEGKAFIRYGGNIDPATELYGEAAIAGRDLNVAVITAFALGSDKPVRIYRTGTHAGLSAIRIGKEVPNVGSLFINTSEGGETIRQNIVENQIATAVTEIAEKDIAYLSENKNAFDVIDLTLPTNSIEVVSAAVLAIDNGGLLCISAKPGGIHSAIYGVVQANAPFEPEMEIRSLITHCGYICARNQRILEPLFTVNTHSVLRVYLRVVNKPNYAKLTSINNGYVFYDDTSFYIQPQAIQTTKGTSMNAKAAPVSLPVFDAQMKIAGPIYFGPIKDNAFVMKVIDVLRASNSNLVQYVTLVLDELDDPFVYSFAALASRYSIPNLSSEYVFPLLRSRNYKCSFSHLSEDLFKTNATPDIIASVLKDLRIE